MKKILFLLIIPLIIFGFWLVNEAKASASDNVFGWAWSENIGWISFNSTNCNVIPLPPGCPSPPFADYGVNIDASGNFSGHAWSENIGWISFTPSGPYPGAPAYSAKLDTASNEVTGWARACAGTVNGDCNSATRTDGWDGWIKLAGTASEGSPYGVSRSVCDLTGYAWGSDVVGWIKFNGSGYKVVTTFCEIGNQPPSANNLQVTQPDYCIITWPSAIFSWQFTDPDGDPQSAYQAQVDDDINFPPPFLVDSEKVISSSNSYATLPGKLSWNTTYYWRLKVWDSKDAASSFISGTAFASPEHQYPTIDFSWIPQNPTVNENTQFTDKSEVYGGATKSSWLWTFQNGSPANSTLQNPLVKFLSTETKLVTLRVTDSDGFSCPSQKTLSTLMSSPDWREIAPF